ncbi:MAG: SGNH/GDSL hydrolase family protein [Planctomycetia bacterium]|nr:SGNH/GDSL hydrolase family protein [Planctomycetia bacterium]
MTCIVTLACALVGAVADAALSDVVVFGDSLSDTGNTYSLTEGLYPAFPYFEGRSSNGPVWVEHLAADLGLPAPIFSLSPDGGTDCAYGGAETGSGFTYYFILAIPNLGTQIETYLDDVGEAAADDLFVVWGGGNDFLDGQSDISVPVASLANHVNTLAAAGAEEFLVPNLPPLGQTPRYHGTVSEKAMDNLSIAFNAELAAELDTLATTLAVTIHRLDVFAMFQRVLADPAAFGFTNVTDQALNDGSPVPNPEAYLFWDDIHPTAAGHAWLGELATLAVLEPTPGDANLDGAVNDADASRLGAHWRQQAMATWSDGDFNLDGKVTDADAAILAPEPPL